MQTTIILGHTPSTAGTFRKKFRKNSGKTPEMLSERFLEFPSRVRLGCPKPYNSRHLRLPERFQNSLPPSAAGDASFFRIGSGEGLSELVMEFPAVLGVFLTFSSRITYPMASSCYPMSLPQNTVCPISKPKKKIVSLCICHDIKIISKVICFCHAATSQLQDTSCVCICYVK